jgi:DNA-directed RNA polymerase specialized sigma24 family protein
VSALRHGRRPVTLKEIEVVYRRDGAAFEQIAGAIVGDEEFGCDAVHDAFVQALRHRDRFRLDAPVEASVWRFVIGEARKRRARIVRGTQPRAGSGTDRGYARRGTLGPAIRARAGTAMEALDPPETSTPDELVLLGPPPTRWESVIDAASTANRKRWRWLVRVVSVAGVAFAAGASAAALAWSFGGGAHGTVLQRAAATLGDRPVLHFVIRSGWGGALIDLKTGSRNYLYATEEFWYERGRRIHDVSRFAGVAQGDATYSADGRSSLNKKVRSLVTRYRQALRDKSALVLGRDVVEGHQVYWIRVDSEMLPDAHNKLHKWAHDVAVSEETFEPVAVREVRDGKPGPDGNSIVLKAESVPKDEGNFTRMPRDSSGLPLKIAWTGFFKPSEASAVLGRPALWAGHSVAGLDLARIWKDERGEGYNRKSGGWAKTYTGVTFFYGTLDDNGDPASSRNASGAATPMPFVQVSESRTLDSLFQRVVTNYSPPEGSILVFDARIAVMQKDGLYLALEGSSKGILRAAARTLERVPSSDTSPNSVSPSISGVSCTGRFGRFRNVFSAGTSCGSPSI